MDDALYRRLLGDGYAKLPVPLQLLHDVRGPMVARGLAKVERGRGPFVTLLAGLFGFPRSGDDVPLTVTFTPDGDREVWERNFSGKRFCSTQELGRGRQSGHLVERFGPLAFGMTAAVRNRQLHLELCSAWFWFVPLPSILHPRVVAFEHDGADRFNFHVDLGLPLVGRLVRYTGWLEPVR